MYGVYWALGITLGTGKPRFFLLANVVHAYLAADSEQTGGFCITEDKLNNNNVLQQIMEISHSAAERTAKAQQIADAIRQTGPYRWVGIYDVTEQEIAIIAWSGVGAPAYPRFPVTQGLSSHAVATRRAVISNDVTNDPRYLTAFGSTQSEIIVPIISAKVGWVVGTLDVESDKKGKFKAADQERLEAYGRALVGLWE